jgi:hypothetical protein
MLTNGETHKHNSSQQVSQVGKGGLPPLSRRPQPERVASLLPDHETFFLESALGLSAYATHFFISASQLQMLPLADLRSLLQP